MTATHKGKSPVLHAVMRDELLTEVRATMKILHGGERDSVVSVAESHLPMYAAVAVAVMVEHLPDADGNCSTCRRPRRWWRWWELPVHAPCRMMINVSFALNNSADVLRNHLVMPGRASALMAR
jgi:hypothetical protein